jgi:Protein of unknown function (DUF2905)
VVQRQACFARPAQPSPSKSPPYPSKERRDNDGAPVYTLVMADFGRVLIVLGIALAVAGVALVLLGRAHVPLGRLPGDIVYHGKNTTVYFPLATSVLASVVLSVVLYLIGRFRR